MQETREGQYAEQNLSKISELISSPNGYRKQMRHIRLVKFTNSFKTNYTANQTLH